METVFQLVKKAERNLTQGAPIKIGKYATHNHVEKIATIDAYLNSQHISGPTDSLNREKPFFNIVLLAAYTWFKTTDIDRKHITFVPANVKQRLKALVATIKLREWMNKQKFGQWLNKWGWTLSCYGSAVSKFIEKKGELIPSVISWDRMICDPVDFYGNIKVEKIYFTPAQLRQQPYDPEAIEEVIAKVAEKVKETRKTLTGQPIDVQDEYIGVYEAHGELPLYYLTGNEDDWTTYRQQMHALFIEQNPKDKRKNWEVSLYSGKEGKDPYHLAHLLEQEGRTLAIGAVESLFDPQWMMNHSMKQIKDQLDLSSKLVSQTADPDFLGRNVLTEVDTGSILIHKEGQPLEQVNLQSHDIPNMVTILEQWMQGARDIAGVHEAVTGEQPPSGTPYSLQAMLGVESRALFNLMRQNKGLCLEEILKKYILPHFKKTLNNSEEVIATLDGEELEQFDNLALSATLSEELLTRLSKGHIPGEAELMMAVEEKNNAMGNVRVMKPSNKESKTWKNYFEDLDMDAIEIQITGESRDKQAILTSLDTLLQRMMINPEALRDPNIQKLFNKIIDEIGPGIISPLQLTSAPPIMETTGGQPAPQPMPAGAGAGEVGALRKPIAQRYA